MVKKIGFFIALIFNIYIKFLDEFKTVLLTLLLPSPTTLLLSLLNAFRANISDNAFVFNKEINNAAILLKP